MTFCVAVQSTNKLPKGEREDEGTTSDVSNYIALIHDVGTWKIALLPANYRLRYICEKGKLHA